MAHKKKTKIVSTHKHGVAGAQSGKTHKGGKKFAKRLTSKVRKVHKGYPMKGIVKGTMTYKRKGRKR